MPTKIDLNKAKTAERKIEIDNGVALAGQIDSLRSTFAQERLVHEEWKKSSTEELKNQLKGLQDGIDAKNKEILILDKRRAALLEPLDKELKFIGKEKRELIQSQNEFFLDQERHQEKAANDEKNRLEIFSVLKRAKQNERNSKKALVNSKKLESDAQVIYEAARLSKEQHDAYYEKRKTEIDESYHKYEVANSTLTIREKAVEDKELELSERETLLKDRTSMQERNIKRQQNGTS